MNIVVKRKYFKQRYTIGSLSIDGEKICDTLEPASFKTSSYWSVKKIKESKTLGYKAIPAGTYKVEKVYSQRFKRTLLGIMDVPGFIGIRIHAGNYPSETSGCILPGWNRRVGMVCNSRSALSIIEHTCEKAFNKGEKVYIIIKN